MKNLNEALAWRYATNEFDTSREIPEEDLQAILEAGNLMPTAYGLQPFRIIVITNQELKEKLREATYGQAHAVENSALVVLAIRTDIDEAMIDEYTSRLEEMRSLSSGSTEGFGDMMKRDLLARDTKDAQNWATHQAYLALGGVIAAASERGIDNHGLEGFSQEKYNEILGLTEQNLHATVLLALGYRAEGDEWQHYAKVRVPNEEMIIYK